VLSAVLHTCTHFLIRGDSSNKASFSEFPSQIPGQADMTPWPPISPSTQYIPSPWHTVSLRVCPTFLKEGKEFGRMGKQAVVQSPNSKLVLVSTTSLERGVLPT
jgi:hypothetical protein